MNKHDNRTTKPAKRTVHISSKYSPYMKRWRDLTSLEKMRAATTLDSNFKCNV